MIGWLLLAIENMKQRLSIFAGVMTLWMFFGILPFHTGLFLSSASSDAQNVSGLFDSKQLSEAIHLSAGYLLKRCDHVGKFLYRVNLNPDVTPEPKYNFLRHSGTIYALSEYTKTYPDAAALQIIERAAVFLKKASIAPIPERAMPVMPIPERHDQLAVWSVPSITGSGKPVQAKLGGTGLGLVALLGLEQIKPGTTSLDYLRRMGNFIVFMQKEDGSFYSKFYPHHGGKNDQWTSLYYPGEAALGLLMLYEKDPDPLWLQSAANAIAYLARLRADKSSVPADHWALLATARLLPLYDRCRQPVPRSSIVNHAIQICKSILAAAPHFPANVLESGCLTNDGRTTPTAIRLEGLLAALTFLPGENNGLRRQIVATTEKGIDFLLKSQIKSGEHAGAIPRAVIVLPEDNPQFSKSFNERVTEVRIDYVQHALSAMLQYQQLFFQKRP